MKTQRFEIFPDRPVPRRSRASSKSLFVPHDLDVIVKLKRVNAPKQARSEKRLQDIIQALDSLLDGRPFEEITIPDIAARAGCVPASIYARFKDKRSILVALYESIRDQQITWIDESMRLEQHETLSLDESLLSICRSMVAYYSRYQNLLRPAYFLGDHEIYERVAAVIRHASDRIAAIVRQKGKIGGQMVDERIDLATRAAYALLQQRMIFSSLRPGRHMPTNDEGMAAELALLFKLTLRRAAR